MASDPGRSRRTRLSWDDLESIEKGVARGQLAWRPGFSFSRCEASYSSLAKPFLRWPTDGEVTGRRGPRLAHSEQSGATSQTAAVSRFCSC